MKSCIILLSILLLVTCRQKVQSDIDIRKYKDYTLVDIHNHDAYPFRYIQLLFTMQKYGIDQSVLFGSISEPQAQFSDRVALRAARFFPRRFIPFSAGVNIHHSDCLDYVDGQFFQGSMGVGEVVAASQFSPMASSLAWKGEHPMDAYFPEIYRLCGEAKRPVLLHIDPLRGMPLVKLEEALDAYPDTVFILGHGNAFNTPELLGMLLENHSNLYIDFFAGFTAFSPESSHELDDFVPYIEQYPHRFMLSSDSAYGLNYDQAYSAYYLLMDQLKIETARKVAGENFLKIINRATAY